MFLHCQKDLKIRFFVMYVLWLILVHWLGFLLLWTFGELSISNLIYSIHSPQALEVIASSSGGKRILWHLIRVCKFDVKQLMKNRGGEYSGKHLVQEEKIKHRGEIEEIILDM